MSLPICFKGTVPYCVISSCVVSELVPISFGVFESFQGMYVHVENILLHQPTGLRCLNVLKDSQAV